MTLANRIISIETKTTRGVAHPVIVAVHTRDEARGTERRWTQQAVLDAMNRAERFYTEAPNLRKARVQRYTCIACAREHIRTHISDSAIHELALLPRPAVAVPPPVTAPTA